MKKCWLQDWQCLAKIFVFCPLIEAVSVVYRPSRSWSSSWRQLIQICHLNLLTTSTWSEAQALAGMSTNSISLSNFWACTDSCSLLAIMLSRLQMTVDQCIDTYTSLSDRIFQKKRHCVKWNSQVQGRFDSDKLERCIKEIIVKQGLEEDALLRGSPDTRYKVKV